MSDVQKDPDERADAIPDAARQAAAEALHERWPSLGIVARAVVHRHPSKREIADVALDAAAPLLPGGEEADERTGLTLYEVAIGELADAVRERDEAQADRDRLRSLLPGLCCYAAMVAHADPCPWHGSRPVPSPGAERAPQAPPWPGPRQWITCPECGSTDEASDTPCTNLACPSHERLGNAEALRERAEMDGARPEQPSPDLPEGVQT